VPALLGAQEVDVILFLLSAAAAFHLVGMPAVSLIVLFWCLIWLVCYWLIQKERNENE
jgi:hypothetical protein